MDSHLVFIFYAFMLGGLAAVSLPHVLVVGIEGIAAGAMLTMIGATMLPGAAHIGGGSAAATSRA